MTKTPPPKAQAVIIGGGVIGCSIAYHLTKIGWTDVVLVERRKLTSGTTWHAAGLIGQLRDNQDMTKLAKYTAELYAGLEDETGQATGFKQNGSLSIATHEGRLEEFKRRADMAKVFGLRVDVIGPRECRDLYPLIEVARAVRTNFGDPVKDRPAGVGKARAGQARHSCCTEYVDREPRSEYSLAGLRSKEGHLSTDERAKGITG